MTLPASRQTDGRGRLYDSVVEEAERHGDLKPGQTVVEATSGNTGIGLAMVCAAKGYALVVTMADSFSIERRRLTRFLGAKVVLTPRTAKGLSMARRSFGTSMLPRASQAVDRTRAGVRSRGRRQNVVSCGGPGPSHRSPPDGRHLAWPGDDLFQQFGCYHIDAHAALRQLLVELLAPTSFRVQRVGVLEAQEAVESTADARQQR